MSSEQFCFHKQGADAPFTQQAACRPPQHTATQHESLPDTPPSHTWRCRFHARLALPPPGQPSCPQGISGSPLHFDSSWRDALHSELGLGLEGIALHCSILAGRDAHRVGCMFWKGRTGSPVLHSRRCGVQQRPPERTRLHSPQDPRPHSPELLLLCVTLTQWSLNLDRTSCATAAHDSRHSPGSKKLNVW